MIHNSYFIIFFSYFIKDRNFHTQTTKYHIYRVQLTMSAVRKVFGPCKLGSTSLPLSLFSKNFQCRDIILRANNSKNYDWYHRMWDTVVNKAAKFLLLHEKYPVFLFLMATVIYHFITKWFLDKEALSCSMLAAGGTYLFSCLHSFGLWPRNTWN